MKLRASANPRAKIQNPKCATYRAAIIGCGRIGCAFDDDPKRRGSGSHAGAYINSPRFDLVALCDQLDLFTVVLREQKFLGAAQRKKLRAEGTHHEKLLETILEQGIAAGEFRPLNVTVTTLAILGMCNWLYEWYSPDGALEPRQIASMFSSLILGGLSV